MIYLDSCALVKLVHREQESDALLAWLRQSGVAHRVSSVIAEIEVSRTLLRASPAGLAAVPNVMGRIGLLELEPEIRTRAASYASPYLRSLDAIHLATAQQVGASLTAFVTYDKRLASAASVQGLPVVAPA